MAQPKDSKLLQLKAETEMGLRQNFKVHSDGTLRFQGRLCISEDLDLRKKILEEAHNSRFFINPGSTKMYKDLKQHF